MKRKIIFISFFLWVIAAQQIYSQEHNWYNSSNFYEPQIIFSNPAGIAFKENRQVILSSQLLYTGLDNDNLSNYYLGYIEPLNNFGTLGFRGLYFNSHILKQGAFSLLYNKLFFGSKLSLGINFNLHHYSYDRDNFQLVDSNDPLLTESTYKNAFGLGIGLIYNPMFNLQLGMSLDDVNQPDISLEGGKANKPLSANFGINYRILDIVTEFDIKHFQTSHRGDTYYIFGLKQLLFNTAAMLSLQYQPEVLSAGAAYSFGDLRIDYNYNYPMNEIQEITSGSHQFTFIYNFGSNLGYPSAPIINLLSEHITEVDTGSFNLQAQVIDRQGLQQINVLLNEENIGTYQYAKKDKSIAINIPVYPLKNGNNKIEIIASNENKKSSKNILVKYHAPEKVPIITSTPNVDILTPMLDETAASSIRLKMAVEFIPDLKDIKIKVNGKDIQLRGINMLTQDNNIVNLEAELDLEEGMNDIEVIAYNQRGSSSLRRSIRYNPITESLYDELWAVVIGVDNYIDNDVKDLNYAVHDARGVEKVLKEQYNFNHVIPLYNKDATKINILRALSTQLKDAKENDGIFIFFAGHGSTGEGVTGGPLGYIVPADGTLDQSEFYVKNIPMSTIKEMSQTIMAKHIYYVMDCCYGGLLLRGGRRDIEPVKSADYSFLKSIAKRSVRQVLTAGGRGQPVIDGGLSGHSVFTGRLIQGLQGEADLNKDGFITAEEINFFVRQRVHLDVKDIVRGHPTYRDIEQTPQYGKWSGEGEFIFTVTKR